MLKDDGIVPLAELHDYPTMLSIVAGGETALGHIAAFVASRTPSIPLSDAQLVCPIERPGKFLAIGMNYRKHAEEGERHGIPAPKQQLWFNKQTTCLSGPFDPIDPGVTEKLDYEVELGVIVGTAAKGVTASAARSHVFGYVVVNDVSARDWQFHSPTFTVGKSFDTHGPIGPWIVTADEIADPHDLRIRCLVNGEVRQDSNSNELIYNIWEQIAYLSTAFMLEPGDILATGTPEGVGVAMDPPRFLKPGDVVRCEVDKIGAIENVVSAP
ncbi:MULTISPECIES: fumarylacetoacetate hydrolase family protein [unclassified Sphingobium]|uniref:fumarylacetoacetate hydrolase family protein n=1 Tax=unclassified Sphingobium TaxID=2611147 RepID=UPI001EE2D0F7|nr:fumarylacetoacetate hydrolase family protein [Sphingobium sp. YBL2]